MEKDNRVWVGKQEEYHVTQIREKLLEAFGELGGLSQWIQQGETVLLKVNLLMGKHPDAAVTTHPAMVEALAGLLRENGNPVIIGDSPGGFFNARILQKAYEKAGLKEVAKRTGATLNLEDGCREVKGIQGFTANSLRVAEYYFQADKVINLPKLKTHAMMTYTGAVKNLFGIIPGTDKADLHLRMADTDVFANLLIDIAENFPPVLHIMDGIVGMEGDGPSSGTPRKIGALLISANPHMLDYAACSLAGLTVQEVPTLQFASERELVDFRGMELAGLTHAAFQQMRILDFKKPSSLLNVNFSRKGTSSLLGGFVRHFLESKPVVGDSCIACGVCRDHCPAKVIEIEKKAFIQYENCIKCYCCHELCPVSAIHIQESFLVKLLKNR